MTEGTATRPILGPPPVRHWPALDIAGTDFDPVLAELMREGPVSRVQLPHGEGWAWLVTRYEDVRMVTGDPRFTRAPVVGREVTRLAAHFNPRRGSLAFADPPDHHRLRSAVAPAFTPRGVERLRSRARDTLHEMVDELLADGPPADLVERVLEPFPVATVCEVMGVLAADRDRMRAWTRRIASPSGAAGTAGAKEGMHGWFAEAIRARRDSTEDDVISLLGAAVGRGDISEEEAIGLAGSLQTGGEAVTACAGQMLFTLLTRPPLLERLRAEPAVRPRAVDELLRWVPHRSAVGPARIAQEDLEIHGVLIAAGDAVHVSYLAANRDPAVFPDPERIDFDRRHDPHVAFGHGPHHCVGGLLARMQTELLVDALADRLPGLRLAVPPREVPWRRGTLIRGPEALPVTW
ncbi:cytochrome P450 [Streptomyces lavendofoliae]|uniref:cytochrome P450 n=1 Tax=Streptomyces lavendofoliae TaxID=67314 RepID=UPI00300EFE8D